MNTPEITTILGKGSAFDGKLTFEGAVRIDGEFSGEIRTDGTLIVGETAEVKAESDGLRGEVKAEINGFRAELVANMARLDERLTIALDLRERIVALEAKIRN